MVREKAAFREWECRAANTKARRYKSCIGMQMEKRSAMAFDPLSLYIY